MPSQLSFYATITRWVNSSDDSNNAIDLSFLGAVVEVAVAAAEQCTSLIIACHGPLKARDRAWLHQHSAHYRKETAVVAV